MLAGVAPEHPSSDCPDTEPASGNRAWSPWPVVVTLGVALLGVASVLAAVLLTVTPPDVAVASASASATDAPAPNPTPSPVPSRRETPISIADLADPEWVERMAEKAAIPPRALAAYAGAALSVQQTHPHCGLGWNTLAAIGHVETEHGSIFGGSLSVAGVATPAIVGVELSGNGVDAIADTDDGRFDGDPTCDRAVGPMQFIPSTWAQFAQDGNGDGITDIHQIDDAALTAAHYLCAAGRSLHLDENWIAAVGAYNSSTEYNNRVAAAASHYASLV
ncbi:hypothetical protein D6T64_01995 [Cryobacterium melibiosiphilum]|uniref:Transglycosylase SLT domain-containing protein n=2 Tax=Cryobacterium melibiosiphilum TaxID=995039 RepID=A0A3A5MMK7_9MICO|nr:hypothetical protein D6T64_01995 [Cryobacterium melibiosiphilum]